MNRRAFLRAAGIGAASTAAVVVRPFGGTNTAAASTASVKTLSGNVTFRTPLTVAAGERVRLDPNVSTTVTMDASNLVVNGVLEMRPASPEVIHTIRFVNVNEASFVGGGMDVLPTDIGLWVMGAGQLDIAGSRKTGWNRTGSDTTWTSADELIVTPTAVGDTTTFAPFTMGSPVPLVNAKWRAEVLNLSRNVRIEGTATGRSHIFIHSSSPQTVSHAAIRYMGPRKDGNFVLGRYGLHFHHCMDGSRGSLVEGVVVRDGGSHSFVPHMSHGVTFRDCIAYSVQESAYWWDDGDETHDVLYDRCVAAFVKTERGTPSQYTVTGFDLNDGERNTARGCVAVGVQGLRTSSGFLWPSKGPKIGVWTFENCLAHNNAMDGIYSWQNDAHQHVISNYESYRNGKAGIEHGAYVNRYTFQDMHHYQDGWNLGSDPGTGCVVLHAVSAGSATPISFTNVTFDGGGTSRAGLHITHRTAEAKAPVVFTDCRFLGHTETPVRIDDRLKAKGWHDFVRSTVGAEARDLEPTDFAIVTMTPGSIVRVQRKNGTAYQMDHTGKVTTIPAFAA